MKSPALNSTGFTLIELITVVIIIAILASLAIPNYIKTVERAKDKEAIINLKLIKAAQKIYYLENNVYYGIPPATNQTIDDINANLKVDLNDNVWAYKTYGASGGLDQARAYRKAPEYTGNVPQNYERWWTLYFSSDEPTCYKDGNPWGQPACPPGP